jgi:hypothetical protein
MRKKDRLTHFDQAADSNFVERDHLFQKEDLERMW